MTNHKPATKNTLPEWVFIQKVDSDEYRHEIRRVPKGFRVYCNVSEANGGGYPFPQTFATYQEAIDTLCYFRPGARLVESPDDKKKALLEEFKKNFQAKDFGLDEAEFNSYVKRLFE